MSRPQPACVRRRTIADFSCERRLAEDGGPGDAQINTERRKHVEQGVCWVFRGGSSGVRRRSSGMSLTSPDHYQITIFAGDTDKIDADENSTAAFVGFNLHFHTLAKATLTGVWGH